MIIREPYNEMVRNGTKTILLNPGKPKYKNLPMGSNIFLFGNNGPCIVRVNERKIYTSFRAALEDNDIQKILPELQICKQRLISLKQPVYSHLYQNMELYL